jgi:hypothetical protein
MQEQGWESHMVAWAQEVVQSIFKAQYLTMCSTTTLPTNNMSSSQDGYSMDFYGNNVDIGRELDRYLGELWQGKWLDVLDYWRSRTDLPGLQRIAWDYLCVPGTCAESEHVFSAGWDVIGDKRSHL